MDVFTTREADVPELTQSQIAEMEADMVRQARESGFAEEAAQYPVSYTHLDVYKRQSTSSRAPACCAFSANDEQSRFTSSFSQ